MVWMPFELVRVADGSRTGCANAVPHPGKRPDPGIHAQRGGTARSGCSTIPARTASERRHWSNRRPRAPRLIPPRTPLDRIAASMRESLAPPIAPPPSTSAPSTPPSARLVAAACAASGRFVLAIIGPGALGLHFAARLEGVVPVALIARDEAAAARLRAGVEVDGRVWAASLRAGAGPGGGLGDRAGKGGRHRGGGGNRQPHAPARRAIAAERADRRVAARALHGATGRTGPHHRGRLPRARRRGPTRCIRRGARPWCLPVSRRSPSSSSAPGCVPASNPASRMPGSQAAR